jgi:hypothetical protein
MPDGSFLRNVQWTLLQILFFPFIHRLVPIDYGCEGGRFPISASCVTISNPASSSKTEVNPGIRS